jgi:hypothetical protein
MNDIWKLFMRSPEIRVLEMCETHGYRDVSGPQYYLWFFDKVTDTADGYFALSR